MRSNRLGRLPSLPIRIPIPEFRIVKVLAPILEKLLLIDDLIASIAVSIPTRAIMPIAMISEVNTVRNNCPFTAVNATEMFSLVVK